LCLYRCNSYNSTSLSMPRAVARIAAPVGGVQPGSFTEVLAITAVDATRNSDGLRFEIMKAGV
jgi:hypothetical protein